MSTAVAGQAMEAAKVEAVKVKVSAFVIVQYDLILSIPSWYVRQR